MKSPLRSGALVLLAATFFTPLPAFAQSNREVSERMEKLERDLMTVQRQVARSNGTPVPGGEDISMLDSSNASLEVRLSGMEEELRRLRGKVEESDFQTRKLSESFSKYQQDTDMRLQEMQTQVQAAGEPKPLAREAADDHIDTSGETKVIHDDSDASGSGKVTPKGNPKDDENFETPRDHYNYAFRLLNQTRYEDAAASFKSFTEQYPKDPLVGNAYYWLGETYYIRRDYVKAADHFRQGFEALPGGPKAADNLLKLSMSLSALKKPKEACVVLDQLLVKFKDSAKSVVQKAEAERTRVGCK